MANAFLAYVGGITATLVVTGVIAPSCADAQDSSPATKSAQSPAGATVTRSSDADTQAKGSSADTATTPETETVVVEGIRGSLEDSVNQKKHAQQILDSITAEDAGKLPDNNVVEAIAHVTGVTITRQNGEGADVAIRGMQEVGTTINGNAAAGGELRSMNHNAEDGGTCTGAQIVGACNGMGPSLSDIPAELIKSVTVYKTRTADQVEGGIAGTVDIELRRPLDMPKGWTVAGSARDVFSNIGDTKSPYASLLLADRFQTGIGEMGFLLNMAYDRNRSVEQQLVNESPDLFYGAGTVNGAPTTSVNYIAPYRVWNGVIQTDNKRPSANLSMQWRAADNLDFVLEGTYTGSRLVSENDYLELRTQGDYGESFSNVVLEPDGQTVRSMTVEPNSSGFVPMFTDSTLIHQSMNSYNTNFETHWNSGRWNVVGAAQYDWSNVSEYDFYSFVGLNNLPYVNVNLQQPAIALPAGYSLANPANYTLMNFHDDMNTAGNRAEAFKLDATYKVSDEGFFRSVQSGVRFTHATTERDTGYRDSFPNNGDFAMAGTGIPLTDFPTGGNLAATNIGSANLGIPSWYHLNDPAVYADMAAVRTCLLGLNPNVPQCKAGVDAARFNWSTVLPADLDHIYAYNDHEHTAAFYSQFTYAFDAYFPVDGVIGARAVRTWGGSNSTEATFSPGYTQTYYTPVVGTGRYTDILPSANAVIHFRPDLQLRLAYTGNVERPSFAQLSPFIVADQNNMTASAGNPNLQPNRIRNYDASLEHYFGRGGQLSLAAYLKKESAPFFYWAQEQYVPALAATVPVYQNRNAGEGTYQGYEFSAQSFFDFLPRFWRNFGAGVNGTFYQKFQIVYPPNLNGATYPGSDNAPDTSKYSYNAQLFYDDRTFSARLSYNYRSKYQASPYYANNLAFTNSPSYTQVTEATSRLDAALNYTIVKQLTVFVEGSNLLNNSIRTNWSYSYLPEEIRLQARTIQVGIRFRN
jgi:iron complex outermembrane recepter protein